jgi:hypothetical protein
MDQINPKPFTTKTPRAPSLTKKSNIEFAVLGAPLCSLGGEAFATVHP